MTGHPVLPTTVLARMLAVRVCAAILLAAALVLAPAPDSAAADEQALWAALASGGHVALLHHARAPGTGDPAGFTLDDCSTQRTLSGDGRDQARRIGMRFRDHGIASAEVWSSQWCRCLETARLLDLGPVAPLPLLNSFFGRPQRREASTEALRLWIAEADLDGATVLVTHQVNITALSGVYPASGELVVVRRDGDGRLSVAGTIRTE